MKTCHYYPNGVISSFLPNKLRIIISHYYKWQISEKDIYSNNYLLLYSVFYFNCHILNTYTFVQLPGEK